MKPLLAILVGTTAIILPFTDYVVFYSSIPCPDCKYLGGGIESQITILLFGVLPIVIQFYLAYLLTLKEKAFTKNMLHVSLAAAVFALLHATIGNSIDDWSATHLAFSSNYGGGYQWWIPLFANIGMAFLLCTIVFRQDLLRNLFKK